MSKAVCIFALSSFALGLAAPAEATAAAPNLPRCEIRVASTADGVDVDGIVFALPGQSGDWRLLLAADGPSGQTQIGQEGIYKLDSSGRTTVAHNELGVGDRYRASMALNGGSVACESVSS